MMQLKLATAALLGLTAVSALAQAPPVDPAAGVPKAQVPGYEPGLPVSNKASNITPADTRSAIAPALPRPPVGDNADPRDYLRVARAALSAGKTGEAQVSLEMAETRLLTRETTPDRAAMPSDSPLVTSIRHALTALGNGDNAQAIQVVDLALARQVTPR
jgi:hypothetical protein